MKTKMTKEGVESFFALLKNIINLDPDQFDLETDNSYNYDYNYVLLMDYQNDTITKIGSLRGHINEKLSDKDELFRFYPNHNFFSLCSMPAFYRFNQVVEEVKHYATQIFQFESNKEFVSLTKNYIFEEFPSKITGNFLEFRDVHFEQNNMLAISYTDKNTLRHQWSSSIEAGDSFPFDANPPAISNRHSPLRIAVIFHKDILWVENSAENDTHRFKLSLEDSSLDSVHWLFFDCFFKDIYHYLFEEQIEYQTYLDNKDKLFDILQIEYY